MYSLQYKVTTSTCDSEGRLKLYSALQMMQDCSEMWIDSQPEVREYLISTYERVVGEWGLDGVKLDFIDSFQLPDKDPAIADGYAGRDYRSLPDAVDRLMKDVLTRLKKINPDVLVEFRQHYMGPAILQYGNMMRCADCPADPTANRKRICDLRLTSEGIASNCGISSLFA